MICDPCHQKVSVFLNLKRIYSVDEINRRLKEMGASLSYSIYSFRRSDSVLPWQSECYASLRLFFEGKEVYTKGSVDEIQIIYPLATVGSEFISQFADKSLELTEKLGGILYLADKEIDKNGLIQHCESLVTELLDEWGEEPGSESLANYIKRNPPC